LLQSAGFGAVGEAVAAAGAFALDHFVHMVNVLHFGMDGVFRANLAAQAAGDAKTFDDADVHALRVRVLNRLATLTFILSLRGRERNETLAT
jgi:hypothetical protein